MNSSEFTKLYDVDWSSLFGMVSDIGSDLNDRKNRFDKADLIEAGVQAASKERLLWVDGIGFDLVDPKTGSKFEIKSQGSCLYTEVRGNRKSHTSEIKLTNTLTSGPKSLLNTADYLILIDTGNEKTFSAAIIRYETVIRDFSIEKDDGFACKIPTDELEFLCNPEDISLHKRDNMIESYPQAKKRLQSEYVSSFFNNRRLDENKHSSLQRKQEKTSQ